MTTTIPTDPYKLLQFNMMRAHGTFKLGYEIILPRLDDPPTHDLANFLGYCEAWADSIDGHHDSEEQIVFPFLNQKLDFSHEIAQHKIIHAALDAILAHIRAAKTDPTAFDAPRLRTMMQELREPLFRHLDDEVERIAPDKLKVFEAAALEKLMIDLEKYVKDHADPFMILPYMRSHTPPEWKDTWPALPWIIRKLVIPYILAARYSGYWKYAPYAMS